MYVISEFIRFNFVHHWQTNVDVVKCWSSIRIHLQKNSAQFRSIDGGVVEATKTWRICWHFGQNSINIAYVICWLLYDDFTFNRIARCTQNKPFNKLHTNSIQFRMIREAVAFAFRNVFYAFSLHSRELTQLCIRIYLNWLSYAVLWPLTVQPMKLLNKACKILKCTLGKRTNRWWKE